MNYLFQVLCLSLSIATVLVSAKSYREYVTKTNLDKAWIEIKSPDFVKTVKGCKAEIVCEVTSSPLPYIKWFPKAPSKYEKEKMIIEAKNFMRGGMYRSNYTYVIDKVDYSNAGSVFCAAVAGGKVALRKIDVMVTSNDKENCLDTSEPTITESIRGVFIEIQESTVVLPCKIKGDIERREWIKEGMNGNELLESNGKYKILENGSLEINNISYAMNDEIFNCDVVYKTPEGEKVKRVSSYVYVLKNEEM